MNDSLLSVTVRREPGCVVVGLQGEIDLSNAASVERRILDESAAGAALVVDVGGLSYLDSAGLHLFYRLCQAATGRILLVAPPDGDARSVIDLAGVTQLLPVRDRLADAVRECAGGQLGDVAGPSDDALEAGLVSPGESS